MKANNKMNGNAPLSKKNGKANFKFAALLYALSLLLFGLVIIIAPLKLLPFARDGLPDEEIFIASLALTAMNILLAFYLLYIHINDYLAIRATFTIGIIAFLFVFLLYALSSFMPLQIFLGHHPFPPQRGFPIFAIAPSFFTAIALLIFLKVSET